MKKFIRVLLTLSAFTIGTGVTEMSNTSSGSEDVLKTIGANDSYIVTLKNGDATTRKYFLDSLATLGGDAYREYANALKGYAIHLDSSSLDTLKSLSVVSAVYQDISYSTPDEETFSSTSASSYDNDVKDTVGIESAETGNEGAGVTIGIIDTGLFYNQVADSASDTSTKAFRPLDSNGAAVATFTSATDLKDKISSASSFTGTTAKFVNDKVFFEYDYADGDNNVEPVTGLEHGTHVASLAAGNGYDFQGVAPDAQLAIMKVFSNSSSSATTADIISALDDAYALGLDIVNMSLGSSLVSYPGDEPTAEDVAIQNLENNGTIVNIAAGNDGRD